MFGCKNSIYPHVLKKSLKYIYNKYVFRVLHLLQVDIARAQAITKPITNLLHPITPYYNQ